MNRCLYIDVGGFVWEVIRRLDISSSTKNSRHEKYRDKGLIFELENKWIRRVPNELTSPKKALFFERFI